MFARFRQFGRLHKRKGEVHSVEYTASSAGLSDDMLDAAQSSLVALNLAKNNISKLELAKMLRIVGQNPTLTDIEEKLAFLKISNKEHFTFGEFVHLWAMYVKNMEQEETILGKAFQFFDRDGNGVISSEEFKNVMTELGDPLTDEECMLFMSIVDKNNDGQVQYEEFLEALKSEGGVLGIDSGMWCVILCLHACAIFHFQRRHHYIILCEGFVFTIFKRSVFTRSCFCAVGICMQRSSKVHQVHHSCDECEQEDFQAHEGSRLRELLMLWPGHKYWSLFATCYNAVN